MGEMKNSHKISAKKPEGKRQLGRPKLRWEDNILLDFRGKVWEDVDWIYLAQGRGQWRAFMNTVMNLWGIS
jgi:hypothetical protein